MLATKNELEATKKLATAKAREILKKKGDMTASDLRDLSTLYILRDAAEKETPMD